MNELFPFIYLLATKKRSKNKEKSVQTLTTKGFAREIGMSQQSASRILIRLEKEQYIDRKLTTEGLEIQLTAKAHEELSRTYHTLKNLMEETTNLHGKVTSGLGEGGFYIKQKKYRDQFKKTLGFEPYPGTLNLKTTKEEVERWIIGKKQIRIEGFKTTERTFGAITCYEVQILTNHKKKESGALIIPERSHYSLEVIELIAPVYLRKVLCLHDEDEVTIL